MEVVKQYNEFGLKVFFIDGNVNVSITFSGNGDLYWAIHSKEESNKKDFVITKENYEVYKLFEQLFIDIENINIFGDIDIPYDLEDEDEIRDYIIRCEQENEEEKRMCRESNYCNYNKLFDNDNKVITWYSDDAAYEVANILKINKEEDCFRLEFFVQEDKKGYESDFHSPKYIPIRFRNSGSSYFPFNMLFMKMYNNMKDIDDVNEFGHQIHVEEYLLKLKK